jgi:hypothetical protein
LYFTDSDNHRIRKVGVDGIISTVVGNGIAAFSGDGGPATEAQLLFPEGLSFDKDGNLYIADSGNNRVRKVIPNGVITTIAGSGANGFDGDNRPPIQAQLDVPLGIAITADGTRLFVSDVNNQRIRAFTIVNTFGDAAPLLAAFKLTNLTGNVIQKLEADFDGDGTVDFTASDINAPLEHTYDAPGAYIARFTVTDTLGNAFVVEYAVVLQDPSQMDPLFQAIWSGMNEALVKGDIAGAVKYLNQSARFKYEPVFQALSTHLPEIIASYSPLRRVSITASIGEYAVVRALDGQNHLFLVYFLKDADGVWRLDAL